MDTPESNTPPNLTGSGTNPSATSESVKETARAETSAASDELRKASSLAREKSSEIAEQAQRSIREQGENAKRQTSEGLQAFAEAVGEAGRKLEESDHGFMARFVREAAGGLESLSTSVGQRSLEEVIDNVREFGRRNPAMFIAGSILTGVAIGRFARSSAERVSGGGAAPHTGGMSHE